MPAVERLRKRRVCAVTDAARKTVSADAHAHSIPEPVNNCSMSSTYRLLQGKHQVASTSQNYRDSCGAFVERSGRNRRQSSTIAQPRKTCKSQETVAADCA